MMDNDRQDEQLGANFSGRRSKRHRLGNSLNRWRHRLRSVLQEGFFEAKTSRNGFSTRVFYWWGKKGGISLTGGKALVREWTHLFPHVHEMKHPCIILGAECFEKGTARSLQIHWECQEGSRWLRVLFRLKVPTFLPTSLMPFNHLLDCVGERMFDLKVWIMGFNLW